MPTLSLSTWTAPKSRHGWTEREWDVRLYRLLIALGIVAVSVRVSDLEVAMAAGMAPLRDEHEQLMPHIETLREAGNAVGTSEALALVDQAVEFLVHHLIPHAMAEDQALYPVVQRVMGAPQATATMSRDHVEVHRLTESLRELRVRLGAGEANDDLHQELRRVLYGLYAVVRLHFAKEEEVYVPLLELRLDESEAAAMFEDMHHAAASARQR